MALKENKVILTSVLKGSEFINNHNIYSGLFLEKLNDKKISTLNQLKENLIKLKEEKVIFYKFEFSNNHIIIMNLDIIKNDYKNLKNLYKFSLSTFIQKFLSIYKINKPKNIDVIGKVINNNFGARHLFKIKKLKDGSKFNVGYKYLKE